MIGHAFASFASGIPEDRTGAAAFGDAAAVLLLSGEAGTGTVAGETRLVHGLQVTNSAGHARNVEVEAGGTSVTLTVAAGQTLTLAVPLLPVAWRTSPRAFWDGLNIRWKDPA